MPPGFLSALPDGAIFLFKKLLNEFYEKLVNLPDSFIGVLFDKILYRLARFLVHCITRR